MSTLQSLGHSKRAKANLNIGKRKSGILIFTPEQINNTELKPSKNASIPPVSLQETDNEPCTQVSPSYNTFMNSNPASPTYLALIPWSTILNFWRCKMVLKHWMLKSLPSILLKHSVPGLHYHLDRAVKSLTEADIYRLNIIQVTLPFWWTWGWQKFGIRQSLETRKEAFSSPIGKTPKRILLKKTIPRSPFEYHFKISGELACSKRI